MKLRRAHDEDYAKIARLRRKTIRSVNSKDYPADVIQAWSAEAGAQSFRESAATCKRWVALDKDRIIGFCEHSLGCEIARMYVHPDHLRKGVGSRLLKVAEESLKKQGCQEISHSSSNPKVYPLRRDQRPWSWYRPAFNSLVLWRPCRSSLQ